MKFIAVGRIHPERADTRFPSYFQSNETSSIRLFCWASQIVIHINDPRYDDIRTARMNAEHYAQAFISALGLASGGAYVAEITQILDYEDNVNVLGVREEELSLEDQQSVFDDAVMIGLRDPFFRFALMDYTRAIADPVGCAYSCYRAIESLSKAIGGSKKDSYNWIQLNSVLGTDEDTIKRVVKNFSDPIRHGNWVELTQMTWDQRTAMLLFTRDVLIKYMKYGKAKLQEEAV